MNHLNKISNLLSYLYKFAVLTEYHDVELVSNNSSRAVTKSNSTIGLIFFLNIPASFHLINVVLEKERLSYHDNGIKLMITDDLYKISNTIDIQQTK